jgi:hypothetical protein
VGITYALDVEKAAVEATLDEEYSGVEEREGGHHAGRRGGEPAGRDARRSGIVGL